MRVSRRSLTVRGPTWCLGHSGRSSCLPSAIELMSSGDTKYSMTRSALRARWAPTDSILRKYKASGWRRAGQFVMTSPGGAVHLVERLDSRCPSGGGVSSRTTSLWPSHGSFWRIWIRRTRNGGHLRTGAKRARYFLKDLLALRHRQRNLAAVDIVLLRVTRGAACADRVCQRLLRDVVVPGLQDPSDVGVTGVVEADVV